MMRRYESLVILGPDVSDDDIRIFTERYSNLIRQTGGEIIKVEDWGFKKLAYKVNKKDRGRYILLDWVGLPALLTEMERQFKISEEVMRFLSVKIDDNVDLEAFKAQVAGKEQAPAEPDKPSMTAHGPDAEQPGEQTGQPDESTGTPAMQMSAGLEPDAVALASAPENQPGAEEKKEGE
jgi:small subunit ribosomal protein S6